MTKTELLKQLKQELADLRCEISEQDPDDCWNSCDVLFEREEELIRRIAELESTN